jgi:methanol corrinoid protein
MALKKIKESGMALDIDPDDILVRYNVRLEKEITPEEAAEELYPDDPLLKPIAQAVFVGDEEGVVAGLEKAISEGREPLKLIDEALIGGMNVVSKLYDEAVIYLPDVMLSSDAMQKGIEYCKSKATSEMKPKGTVICHVAEGDVHDIGKTIVVALLRANGYNVVDLGRDCPVEEVVEHVEKERPLMLTGTALMTTTMYAFKHINDKLKEKNLALPFVCGGGAVNQDFVSKLEFGVYGEEASQAPHMAASILAGANVGKLREEFHKH